MPNTPCIFGSIFNQQLVQFADTEPSNTEHSLYIQNFVQPSPPSISRVIASLQREALHSVTPIHFPWPLMINSTFFSKFSILATSYTWNHSILYTFCTKDFVTTFLIPHIFNVVQHVSEFFCQNIYCMLTPVCPFIY